MDVRGCFGLTDDVRNGFDAIRATFRVTGDAPAEKLRALVENAQERSAVFDMITNGVPVDDRRSSRPSRCSSPPARPRRAAGWSPSPRRSLLDFATLAADPRPRRELPPGGVAAAPRRRLPRGADPAEPSAGWASTARPRPGRRREPPGPRRRLGRDRGEHAPDRRQHRAPRRAGSPATSGARAAPRRSSASPARRAVMARGRQRAHQDLTRPAHPAEPHGGRLAGRGHKVFCTMSPAATELYAPSRSPSTTTRRALRLRPASPPSRRGCRMNATGTPWACAPRAASPCRFDDVPLPARRPARGFPPAGSPTSSWTQPVPAAASRRPRRSASPSRPCAVALAGGAPGREAAPRALVLVAEAEVEVSALRARSRAPATSSTAPPAARRDVAGVTLSSPTSRPPRCS